MAERIEFIGNGDGVVDNGVHFVSQNYPAHDYTLCGLSLDGDENTTGEFNFTKKKVDCKYCIGIIKYTKKIRNSEFVCA